MRGIRGDMHKLGCNYEIVQMCTYSSFYSVQDE